MKTWKLLVPVVLAVFAASLFVQDGFGQSKTGGSSKPPSSSRSGSSSKPPSSSSSKPPSSSSKPPSSSSKPPATGNSSSKPPSSSSPSMGSKPKFGSPNTAKPKEEPVVKPAEKPKFSSPKSESKPTPPAVVEKPKFSSPKSESKPVEKPVPPVVVDKPKFGSPSSQQTGDTATSRKPKTNSTAPTAKAEAAKEERSRRVYVESQQAKAPPKPVYTTPEGKTVNVRTDSPVTKTIRNNPSSYYRPEVRTQRTETHVTHYHYQHPGNWYYSQPSVYVGGGYSSAFWWMMMEWDAERRAQWFYNHQNSIERDAYERGMRDSAVAQRVAQLKAQNSRIDPDYVDPEFTKDPSLMYTQDHIEAVYNPEVSTDNSGSGVVLLVVVGIGVLCVAAYVLIFHIRWGK